VDYLNSDEYLEYLKKNCGVRGFDIDERTPVSTRPDVEICLRYIRELEIGRGDEVLEVGSGVGRLLKEIHDEYGVLPHGIDPVPKIVEAARERVGRITSSLEIGSAESTSYPDASFDKLLCWGVFDLTHQAKALTEMARLMKLGGHLLLTGKNDDYNDDDAEARAAEIAARRKGITNHFTDWDAMMAFAARLGLLPVREWRFPRRGDFMNDRPTPDRGARFYEYAVLFQKKRAAALPGGDPVIASLYSKTFKRVNGSEG
jgi:SAM-dependent methyltransferase